MEEQIVVYPRKSTYVKVFLFGLVLLGAYGAIVFLSDEFFWSSLLAIPLSVLICVWSVERFLYAGSLIVDTQGIRNNLSVFIPSSIDWKEVQHISTFRLKQGEFICLDPYDMEAILLREPFAKRLLLRAMLYLEYSTSRMPISISLSLLGKTKEEFRALLPLSLQKELV